MTRIRRVLLATDFSKTSRAAFATAVTIARSNRATLTILYVVVPIVPLLSQRFIESATWDRIDTHARRRGQQQLSKVAEKATKSGIRVATLLLQGDPARQIVRTARSKRVDLVVVGTHGRRAFSRFLLGSVAQRVVMSAPCPVVTVRGK